MFFSLNPFKVSNSFCFLEGKVGNLLLHLPIPVGPCANQHCHCLGFREAEKSHEAWVRVEFDMDHIQRLVWQRELSVCQAILLPECNFFHLFNCVVLELIKMSILMNHLYCGSHSVPSYMLPIAHKANRSLQEFAGLLRNGEHSVVICSCWSLHDTKAILHVSSETLEPSVDLVINLEDRAVISPGDAGLSDRAVVFWAREG